MANSAAFRRGFEVTPIKRHLKVGHEGDAVSGAELFANGQSMGRIAGFFCTKVNGRSYDGQ
jgi:hypothetical protein